MKRFYLVVASLFALSLTACGEKPAAPPVETPVVETPAPAPAPATDAASAPAATDAAAPATTEAAPADAMKK